MWYIHFYMQNHISYFDAVKFSNIHEYTCTTNEWITVDYKWQRMNFFCSLSSAWFNVTLWSGREVWFIPLFSHSAFRICCLSPAISSAHRVDREALRLKLRQIIEHTVRLVQPELLQMADHDQCHLLTKLIYIYLDISRSSTRRS